MDAPRPEGYSISFESLASTSLPIVRQLTSVEGTTQDFAHTISMERLGPAATDPALGSKMAVGAIGELPFESVEFGGERGIAEDALCVPFIGQSNSVTFDGVRDEVISAGTIGLTEIGAVVFAIHIGTVGAQAVAVAEGNAAIPQTFASPGLFTFPGFIAQFVDVDFGEGAEDGENQFSPRGSKIKVLRDRNKGDLVLVQVMKSGEQPAEVTVEAVNGVHDHDIEVVLFSTCH